MRLPAKILLLPVASLLFGMTASSYADEALFSRSSQTLGQLWSGVLGCHDPAGASFAPRDRYATDDVISDLDEPARIDYAECARQTLRNESSRMLVQTIEDAVRHGGVLLFDEHFRLDSSVSWVWGENVRGNIDAVIPIWDREHGDGTGSALFMQHGLSLWNGLGSTERIDGNFGLVLRSHLTADTIAGGSLFYDYNFGREHSRLGAGVDVQSGIFRAAANYYYPLSGWRVGRESYKEQALRGADLRLGLALDRLRLDGTAGVWRFEGEDGVGARQRTSYGLEGGYRVLPGVFLEGGYEHHDSRDSLGSRWNAGLAFRFSLPDFEGATGEGGRLATPNLWELADREQRIVYEERLGIVPSVALVGSFATMEEGDGTFAMTFNFDRPLEREVTVVIEPTTGSTVNPARYTISGEASVAPPVQRDEGVSTASAQTGGTPGRLEMALPQHTIALTLTINIAEVNHAEEADEFIELAASTTGENSEYARFDGVMRVAVPSYDNHTVGFAATSSVVSEDVGTAHLLLRLGRSAPGGGIPVSVSATGATDGIAFASPASITIPAETARGQVAQSVASVAVPVTDDGAAEDDEVVIFTISEGDGFPASPWQIDPGATTHTLTILASDQPKGDVGFATGNADSANRGESVSLAVMSSALADADLPLTWIVNPASEVEAATGSVTIASGSDSQSFTINISEDGDAVPADRITVTLAAPDLPVGWSLGDSAIHVIAIADAAAPPPTPFTRRINRPRIVNFATAEDSVDEGASISTTLSISPAPDGEVAIPVTIPANTGAHTIAVAPAEALSNGVITFSADRPSVAFTLNALEDDSDTVGESVTVSLGNPLPFGYVVGDNGDWVVYITDNDEPAPIGGMIGFRSDTDITATEGGSATIRLAFSQALPLDAQIGVAVSGVANASEYTFARLTPPDASFQNGVAQAPMGSTSFTLSMTVPEDDNTENETVTVTLAPTSLPEGWTIGTPSTSRILVTDTTPIAKNTIGFVATSIPVEEGEDIALNAVLKDSDGAPLSTSSDDAIAIDISIVAGSSETSFAGSSIVIPANSTLASGVHRVESFSIDDDQTAELEKTLTLSMAEGGGFPSSSWEIDSSADDIDFVIAPSDNTVIFSAPSSASIGENGGSTSITAAINLQIPADAVPTIAITPGGDARPADYDLSVSGGGSVSGNTWTLPTEQGSATLVVSAVDNEVVADDKTLTLGFDGNNLPNGWSISGATSYDITIANDDEPADETVGFAPPSADFNRVTAREGETTRMRVAATPVAPVDLPLIWTITEGGGKVSGADTGSVTIAQGSASADFDLVITDDSEAGPAESVTITLAAEGAILPAGWVLMPATHSITIPANDNVFAFSTSADGSINEGASTSLALNFDNDLDAQAMLRLDITGEGISSGDITITADKGASFDEDSDDTGSGTLTIPSSATSPVTLTITAESDSMPEPDETLALALSGTHAATQLPEGWSISASNNSQNIAINASGNIVRLAAAAPATDTTLDEGEATGQFRILIDSPLLSEQNLRLTAIESDGGEDDFLITLISPSGSSYDRVTGALTIMPGQIGSPALGSADELVFSVHTVPDDVPELEETLTLTLAADSESPLPSGWSIDADNDEFAFTIPSNGNVFTLSAPADGNINEGASTTFAVNFDHDLASQATLHIDVSGDGITSSDITTTADKGATFNEDSDGTGSGTLTIPGGTTSPVTLTVAAESDSTPEPDEILAFVLNGTHAATQLPEGWSIGASDNPRNITINTGGNIVRLASADPATDMMLEEGAAAGQFRILIDTPFLTEQSLMLAATESGDDDEDDFIITLVSPSASSYDRATGALTIVQGQAGLPESSSVGEVIFNVHAAADDFSEPEETLALTLEEDSNNPLPSGWRIDAGSDEFSFTIPANGNVFAFSSPVDGSITEGTSTTIALNFDHALISQASLRVDISGDGISSSDISITADKGATFDEDSGDAASGVLTIPFGATSPITLTIAAESDSTPEPDETLIIMLNGTHAATQLPNGWSVGASDNSQDIVIPAADNVFTFSAPAEESIDEGADTTLALNFDSDLSDQAMLRLDVSGVSSDDITITADKGASFDESSDNTGSGTLTIPIRTTSPVTLTVAAESDSTREPSETVTLALNGTHAATQLPNGWSVGASGNSQSIAINSSGNVFTLSAPVDSSVDEGMGTTLALNFDNNLAAQATLRLDVSGISSDDIAITADKGASFDESSDGSGTLTIPGGTTSPVTLTVAAESDSTPEPNETVTLTLNGTHSSTQLPNGWSVGASGNSQSITINANGNIFTFSAPADGSIDEGASTTLALNFDNDLSDQAVLRLDISGVSGDEIDITADQGASFDEDSDNTGSGTLTIPSGASSPVILTIAAESDSTPELDETLTLTLNGTHSATQFPNGWSVSADDYSRSITINANGNTVWIAAVDTTTDTTLEEGGADEQFRILIDNPLTIGQTLVLEATESDGGSDDFFITPISPYGFSYDHVTGGMTVVVEPDHPTMPSSVDEIVLSVRAVSDNVSEIEETLTLVIAEDPYNPLPQGWDIDAENNDLTFTIPANSNTVGFQAYASTTETESSAHSVGLDVRSAAPSEIVLGVSTEGTATIETDYTVDTEIRIPANTTEAAAVVQIISDTDFDPGETVKLTISEASLPSGWSIDPDKDTHTITITDDYRSDGTIGFASAGLTAEETATDRTINVPIFASVLPVIPINIGNIVYIYSSTAVNGQGKDYHIPHADVFITQPGNTDLSVFIAADDIPELDETIVLALKEDSSDSMPPGWRVDTDNDRFTITIPANDSTVAFADATATFLENAGTHNVKISINRPHPSEDITLDITTGGSATSGIDYTAVSTPVVIPAGRNSVEIPVTIIDEDVDDGGDETISLAIGGTLPSGWSFGREMYTITIIDDEPGGVVGITSAPLSATLAESNSITIDVAVTNGEGFIAATSEDVVLDVAMTVAGDPDISTPAWRNDPISPNDYTVGSLVIGSDTGRGSFNFTVENDDIAEGLEVVTLTLADPNGNLPSGWRIAEIMNRFIVTVPANDNAARFSEWPRSNPENFVGLSATIEEGEMALFNILIDHIAPTSDLPIHISVPNEYADNIRLQNVDPERSSWDASNSIFTFKRSGNIVQSPNIAASGQILVPDDGIPEPIQSFDITLSQGTGWPSGWGGVSNAPDTGTPAVPTSTTFSVTIPASDNSATFAIDNPSSVVESDGSITLDIVLTSDAPSGGLPLTLTASGDAGSISFDEILPNVATHDFSISEGMSSGQVAVYIQSDDNDDLERVTFTLAAGRSFPEGWGGVPADETHVLNITESNAAGGTLFFASHESQVAEPVSGSTSHIVHINAAGTIPDGGFPLTVVVASWGNDSDYSFESASSNGLAIDTIVTDSVLDLDFSIFADDVPELDETIYLAISSNPSLPSGWRIAYPSVHNIIIPANDNVVSFKTRESSFVGENGSHSAAITVNMPAPSEIFLAVAAEGTATDGSDYTTDSEIRIPAYASEAAAAIEILPDADDDPGETVRLTISEASLPTGWSIDSHNNTHTVTIDPRDNTVGFGDPEFSTQLEEGTIHLTINVDKPAPSDIVLDIGTAGTATRGTDYNIASEVRIPANTSHIIVPVSVKPDSDIEPDETIEVTLSGSLPDRWKFEKATVGFTIHNDDGGKINFASPTSTLEEKGYSHVGDVPVSVTATPSTPFDFKYKVSSSSTATKGVDYELPEILNIETSSADSRLLVEIYDDAVSEIDETIILEIDDSNLPPNLTLGDITTHTITIPPNDNTIRFASFRSTVEENRTHDVEVVIDKPYSQDITFNIETAGTAQEGGSNDYTAATQFVIPANQGFANIPITINRDAVNESIETIEIAIGAADTLPAGWSVVSPSTHTISIINELPSIGIVGDRAANLNEPSTSADSSTTISVAAFDTAGFIAATTEDVPLTVTMASDGDPDIATSSLRNTASSPNDYAIGNLVVDADTGRGSFTFDVLEDTIAEGREVVTLTIEDPDGNLPDGWIISDVDSQFTVNVGANDNAARFSEWNRGEPGSVAGISATIEEGEMLPFNILIDHIAPVGGLPLYISVPDEYADDISFHNIDSIRSAWNADTNIFTFKREGNIEQEPNLAAGAQIRVASDGILEPTESFDITLMQGVGWPDDWGSVTNAADTGAPRVTTSTTFSVTIPSSDNTASFAVNDLDPVSEQESYITLDIELTNDAPAGGLPLTLVASGDVASIYFSDVFFDATTHNFSIAEGMSSGEVIVYIQPDEDNDPESVTFALTAGPDFPIGWGSIATDKTLTLEITEQNAVGGILAFVSNDSGVVEPASGSVVHAVGIDVDGTPPTGGFHLAVVVDSTSTANSSDYSVTPTLSNVLVTDEAIVDGVLTLDFSIFADDVAENDETIKLTISASQSLPTGWSVALPETHTITITNNGDFIEPPSENNEE